MRFAMLYFAMLVLFVVLLAGPIVVGRMEGSLIGSNIPTTGGIVLFQPTHASNNDTSNSQTGTGLAPGQTVIKGAILGGGGVNQATGAAGGGGSGSRLLLRNF